MAENKAKKPVRAARKTEPAPDSRRDRYWSARGVEDVFYQREAQVTWWTVLGGIAAAALLTQLETLLAAVQTGSWHYILFFLATCMIVINTWVQTVWGSLVLKWQISVPTAVVIFFQGLALAVSALSITRPVFWYVSIGVVVVSGVLMQLLFMRYRAWVALPADAKARARVGIYIYCLFALLCAAASVHLALQPVLAVELTWGVVALVVSFLALLWQHFGMTAERERMGIA